MVAQFFAILGDEAESRSRRTAEMRGSDPAGQRRIHLGRNAHFAPPESGTHSGTNPAGKQKSKEVVSTLLRDELRKEFGGKSPEPTRGRDKPHPNDSNPNRNRSRDAIHATGTRTLH